MNRRSSTGHAGTHRRTPCFRQASRRSPAHAACRPDRFRTAFGIRRAGVRWRTHQHLGSTRTHRLRSGQVARISPIHGVDGMRGTAFLSGKAETPAAGWFTSGEAGRLLHSLQRPAGLPHLACGKPDGGGNHLTMRSSAPAISPESSVTGWVPGVGWSSPVASSLPLCASFLLPPLAELELLLAAGALSLA